MIRSLATLAVLAGALVACGGGADEGGTNALVAGGASVRPATGAWTAADVGPLEFATGTKIEATTDGATVDVFIGAGARAEIRMGAGARLARRGANALDLSVGSVTVTTTGLTDRVLIYHGNSVYAEAGRTAPGDQTFTATVVGEQMAVVVARGGVQMNVLNPANRELSFATLGKDEQGLATIGAKPEKRHMDDSEAGPYLTPRLWLTTETGEAFGAGDPLRVEVWFAPGQSGAFVGLIGAADGPDALVLDVSGPGGERSIALRSEHLREGGELSRTVSVSPAAGEYGLEFDVPGHGLTPGTWKVRVRYLSYGEHAEGPEWIGLRESEPVSITITD